MQVMDKQEFMKWTRVSDTHEGASGTAGQHSWSQDGRRPGKLTEARPPRPGLRLNQKSHSFVPLLRLFKSVILKVLDLNTRFDSSNILRTLEPLFSWVVSINYLLFII